MTSQHVVVVALAELQVITSQQVVVVTSQALCYLRVKCFKLDACAKFHDHQSNNN